MTAAKEIKSEGVPVMVESSEVGQLPEAVRKAVGGFSAIPYVVFADPSGSKVFGAYQHSDLKGQDYRSIFRDAKKAVREAQKDGSLRDAKPEAGDDDEAESDDTTEDETPSDGMTDRKDVSGREVETWTSSAGTEIKGRFVGTEPGGVYVFELEDGREVKATSKQLSPASLLKLEELVNGN